MGRRQSFILTMVESAGFSEGKRHDMSYARKSPLAAVWKGWGNRGQTIVAGMGVVTELVRSGWTQDTL